MRFGKEKIPGLTQKPTARGVAYYWQPSPMQRAKGWKSLALGTDLAEAVRKARARNDEVDQWKTGGARPAQVRRFNHRATFGHVLDRYEAEVLVTKAKNTQRVDRTAIRNLRDWAGKHPVGWIDRKRVRALRQAMMAKAVMDGPGHAVAFHLLTTLRKILSWWIKEADLGVPNPADDFGLRAPAPREQICDADAEAALLAAAARLKLPGVALAIELAIYTGQREADLLAFDRGRWREISLAQLGHDATLYDRLTATNGPDAGKVMGLYVRQGKGKVWIGIPIAGDTRVAVETTLEAHRKAAQRAGRVGAQYLISRAGDGSAWPQRDFIDHFAQVRAKAAEQARADGNDELAARLADLQFRDLRRTCAVRLGWLGLNDYQIGSITGHKQETIKKILEVYMPRTEAAAATAIVARIGKSRNSDFGKVGTAD